MGFETTIDTQLRCSRLGLLLRRKNGRILLANP